MSFHTGEQIEAELRRIADGMKSGEVPVSGLPFLLAVVVRSAQEMTQEASRVTELPSPYTRGVGVIFPIEVQVCEPLELQETDSIYVFTREEAEEIYQACIRGEILTDGYARALDVYEPAWRVHRRQYGRAPSHPLWGKVAAPKIGLKRDALIVTWALAVLEEYVQRHQDMAVVVGVCLVARSALWADTLKSRFRLNGEDAVVALSMYENEPLVLAEALFALSENEKINASSPDESSSSKAIFLLATAVEKAARLQTENR